MCPPRASNSVHSLSSHLLKVERKRRPNTQPPPFSSGLTNSVIDSDATPEQQHRRLGFFSALQTSGSFTMMQAGGFRRRLSEYDLDVQSTHETARRRLACASGADITSTLCKGTGADVSCVVPGNAAPTTGRRRLAFDDSTLFFRVAGVVNLLLGGLKSESVDTSKCAAPQKKAAVGPGSSTDTDPDCFAGEQALVVRLVEMYEGVCKMPGAGTWDIKTCASSSVSFCLPLSFLPVSHE